MASFDNNLRLEEITTGAASGTWGTKTNTNLSLIGKLWGMPLKHLLVLMQTQPPLCLTQRISARAMYFKVTSGVSLIY